MCGQRGQRGRFTLKQREEMNISLSLIYKLAKEMSKWSYKPLIKFTGGEPLVLSTDIIDLIGYLKKKGFVVRLSTNGVMLKSKNLADKLVKTGIDVIGFSIDGDKQIHNKIRGTDYAFDASMDGISNIEESKKRMKKKVPLIMITTTLSTLNESQIQKVVDIGIKKRVDWVNFQFFNFTNDKLAEKSHKIVKKLYNINEAPWRCFSNESMAKVDINKLYNTIKKVNKMKLKFPVTFLSIGKLSKSNIKSYFYNINNPLINRMCFEPFSSAFIVPPGKVAFCIDYPFYFCDNLKHTTLEKSWFGEKANNFRKHFVRYYKKNGKNFPHCQRCNWRFNY